MGESTGLHARSDVFLFVNRRRVRNRNLLHALYQAYRNNFMERHPLILLFIEVVPALVDVNIHPRKSEVRFSDERNIHQLVSHSVTEALQSREPSGDPMDVYSEVLPQISAGVDLPQLHNTYILVEVDDGFVLIDQHAAHERILSEQIEEQEIGLGSQKLLFPITLELSRGLSETLARHGDVVCELGFLVEDFGGNTYRIASIPSICASSDPKALLVETLQELSSLGKVRDPRRELLKIVACKAAIKAGQSLSDAEKRKLIEDLLACRHPNQCPHGRPTMVRVSTEELNRRFGRS
jgi:DNA mismatch repair protein MutL